VGLFSGLMMLVVALSVQAVFHLQMDLGASAGLERPSVPWRLAVVTLGLPLSLLIHESGHWIAGTALGQRCLRFLFWPVEFWHDGDRWKFRLIGLGRAALVSLVPSTFDGFRLQRAIILVAGPLASLIASVAFTVISVHCSSSIVFWFFSATVLWLVIGVGNLLPFQLGNVQSDGSKLWEVLRGGAAFDETQRELLSLSSHATAVRPRDWPAGPIVRLAESTGDPVWRRFTCCLAYVHFLDGGDRDRAGHYLHRFLEGWTSDDAPEYALEAAYFFGFHEHDAAAARKWLDLEPRTPEPWVRLRAQAAIAIAEGHPAEARSLIDDALRQLCAAFRCGAHEFEAALLRAMLADCQ
jgi:hypothetical protein